MVLWVSQYFWYLEVPTLIISRSDSIKMTVTQLPLVDFGIFLHGNKDQREQAARQLVESFVNNGFVRLKNHGISRDFVKQIWQWVISPCVDTNYSGRQSNSSLLDRIGHFSNCRVRWRWRLRIIQARICNEGGAGKVQKPRQDCIRRMQRVRQREKANCLMRR
jgi:hypothetical protein